VIFLLWLARFWFYVFFPLILLFFHHRCILMLLFRSILRHPLSKIFASPEIGPKAGLSAQLSALYYICLDKTNRILSEIFFVFHKEFFTNKQIVFNLFYSL
jgi:hypothetical protein